MPEATLVKTRIQGGVWEGILTCKTEGTPEIAATHLGKPLKTVVLEPDPQSAGVWSVKVAIPPELLADGVQTFVIAEADSGTVLNSFAIVTGEPLEDDIRGELDLLRAELDLLKRAFRRHCAETM
ncbi:hypothetical protein [Pseudoruegeria sp. HB172150]|uniref:hypothetical protein n=1 Tax=Pseudoruegeria sp. HB172150 TaxID=2721164 RepID=UPI001553EADF|nr:hypothetical protein [Pseudoruegeria sp. HB172150]